MYSPFDNYPLKLNSFEVGQRQATCGSETGATTGDGEDVGKEFNDMCPLSYVMVRSHHWELWGKHFRDVGKFS